jgi:diguanylate cyclase (GGDEF)-like protein/PAS domain S-box-containing protein
VPPTTPATRAEARFDHRQFLGRLFVASMLALGAATVPDAGPDRFVVALFLALVVVPAHFVVRWIARVPNPTGPLELLAVLAASASAWIEPTVWTTALMFQSLTIAASTAYQRTRWIGINAGAVLVTMAGVAALTDPSQAVPMLIVFGVFIPVLLSGARRLRAGERRATSRVRAAVESLPLMVWEADADTGALVSVTGRVEALLGRPRSEIVKGRFAEQVHPDDRSVHWTRSAVRDVLTAPYRYLRPDGSMVWLRDHVVEQVNERGPIVRGVTIDVTANRTQEIQLRQHQEIVEQMAATTLVLSSRRSGEHRIIHVVDSLRLGAESAVGREFADVFPDLAADPAVVDALGTVSGVTTVGPLRYSPDVERFVELEVFPISDGDTAVLISDVTDRELAARTIRHQAHYDDLTGLPNRVTFMDMLSRRTGAGSATAVLLVDLNRFKEVNDTLGHLSGDAFLRALGGRLAELAVERGCSVARLGGDEFAFVSEYVDNANVAALAQRVLDVCREPVEILGSAVASGASVGVALAPLDAQTPEALLRCADLAMYRAKSSRRGIWWYEPSLDRRSDDVETLGRLAGALRDGEFEMWFQPAVHLASGRVTGCEALARWRHPTRGVLAPDAFLDLIGVAGLTAELAALAIEQACSALARLDSRIHVSLNLSAHDLRNPDLVDSFRSAIERHGVDPLKLVVEITEEHLLDTTGVVASTLTELSDAGVWIAVDDFGTGYSSLTHLRSLPLSHLKIDREFVAGVLEHDHDAVIVRAVTDLAHNLGVRVTAEGVESAEVAAELHRLGCDYAQGYHWAPAMPIDELLARDLTPTAPA